MASGVSGRKRQPIKNKKRTDMYVSTLRSFVHAMGGELEIKAVFPEGSVRIEQFSNLPEH
jgi:hypothetical protein